MPNRCRLRLVMDGRLESVERAGIAVREFGLAAGLDAMAASDLELATVRLPTISFCMDLRRLKTLIIGWWSCSAVVRCRLYLAIPGRLYRWRL